LRITGKFCQMASMNRALFVCFIYYVPEDRCGLRSAIKRYAAYGSIT